MKFGQALALLDRGYCIARAKWIHRGEQPFLSGRCRDYGHINVVFGEGGGGIELRHIGITNNPFNPGSHGGEVGLSYADLDAEDWEVVNG